MSSVLFIKHLLISTEAYHRISCSAIVNGNGVTLLADAARLSGIHRPEGGRGDSGPPRDGGRGHIITSLEMRMKCGIGKCGRCNVGEKYVCKDGPVFSLAELDKLTKEY
jgi:hypothetical protein